MSVEVNQTKRPTEAHSHKQVSAPGWREDDGCAEGGEQEQCVFTTVCLITITRLTLTVSFSRASSSWYEVEDAVVALTRCVGVAVSSDHCGKR
ncbi:hypothetical protein AOLI_G00130640 [Acnodon oligacanthus]